jgi:hypothetical protein
LAIIRDEGGEVDSPDQDAPDEEAPAEPEAEPEEEPAKPARRTSTRRKTPAADRGRIEVREFVAVGKGDGTNDEPPF